MNPLRAEDLYTAYSAKVMAYLSARVQRRADAEDLCADVFEKVYRKLADFDPSKASPGTWIFSITRNTLIDYFRRNRPSAELDENLAEDSAVDDSLLHRETLGELAAALRRLPQELSDIIVFVYADRKPLTEVAQIMGLSYGAIKLRHQKALAMLRSILEG